MVEVLRGATDEFAVYKACADVARRSLDWRRQAFFDESKVRQERPESRPTWRSCGVGAMRQASARLSSTWSLTQLTFIGARARCTLRLNGADELRELPCLGRTAALRGP